MKSILISLVSDLIAALITSLPKYYVRFHLCQEDLDLWIWKWREKCNNQDKFIVELIFYDKLIIKIGGSHHYTINTMITFCTWMLLPNSCTNIEKKLKLWILWLFKRTITSPSIYVTYATLSLHADRQKRNNTVKHICRHRHNSMFTLTHMQSHASTYAESNTLNV